MDAPTWTLIAQLRERFAAAPDPAPHATLAFRVLKLTEETGEAAEALIGATGQNPRKGVTHTMDDLAEELCDVALTALLALAEVTPNPDKHFASYVARLTDRPWPTVSVDARTDHADQPAPPGTPAPSGAIAARPNTQVVTP